MFVSRTFLTLSLPLVHIKTYRNRCLFISRDHSSLGRSICASGDVLPVCLKVVARNTSSRREIQIHSGEKVRVVSLCIGINQAY